MLKDILEYQKKREARVEEKNPDEIAEEFVRKHFPKAPAKLPQKSDELDSTLRQILEQTETTHPENNPDFMKKIPVMHLSWFAIEKISHFRDLGILYALVLNKIYKGNIPFEIEKVILALEKDDLIILMNSAGIKWSDHAKIIMSKFHPETYRQLYELTNYQSNASYLMR